MNAGASFRLRIPITSPAKSRALVGVTARFVQNCTLSGGGRLEASMDRLGGRPFRLRGGGKCCQPFDRTGRLVPRRAAFRDVVGRLVRAAHCDVVTLRGHTWLGSG